MADKKKRALPPQDLASFFESLTMLLCAGVPVNECADIIATDTEGSKLSHAAKRVDDLLNKEGIYVLSEAMEMSGFFPEYAVEMIKLGEDSGRLENTCDSLGDYFRQQESLNQSIRSAISGPLLLLVMMSVVLVFLIVFVLPVFENVFVSLGVSTAGGGMGGAFLAARVVMIVVAVLLVLALILVIMYVLPGGRNRMVGLAEKVPMTRKIHYALSASRFTNGLSMLLASGIPVPEAVEKAGGLVSNRRIMEKIPAAIAEVSAGEDLGKTLVKVGVLDGAEAKILLSASRAGQTEVAMRRLSEIYAGETEAGIDRMLGMIEPALVGLLSVAIGVILLSVMLPLTSIMSAIN